MTIKPLQLVKDRRPVDEPRVAIRDAEHAAPLLPARAHAVIPLVIVALWALAISGMPLREMTDLGLVSVMPVTALALLALLTVSFCIALQDRPLRPWVTCIHVVALIVILYGVTAFVEAEPRVATVYRHVGIIDNLARNGSVDGTIDAYFSWPGFFGLGALVTQAAGLEQPAGDRAVERADLQPPVRRAAARHLPLGELGPARAVARPVGLLLGELGRPGLLRAAGGRVRAVARDPRRRCCRASRRARRSSPSARRSPGCCACSIRGGCARGCRPSARPPSASARRPAATRARCSSSS